MEDNRKEKGTESFVGRVFAACLAAALLLNGFHPAKTPPEDAPGPSAELSWETFVTGSFAQEYEIRLSDRFLGKKALRKVMTAIRRFGGSKKENGVFAGKGGQLLADIAAPDEAALNKNISAIRGFAGRHPETAMTMILVPDAANILKDSLPKLAATADQNAFINNVRKSLAGQIRWVDAAKALSARKEDKIYYKTDHRWTSAGAFYVFLEAAGTLGIEEDPSSMFASYPAAADFSGDLAKISGLRTGERERIDIYVPRDRDNGMIVNYADRQARAASLYVSGKLNTPDKYDVFLGGDTSLIHIETMSERENRLLVIKDSFANCFIQFLAPFYREIVVADPAFFSGDVNDLMDLYDITDVIFLYGGNTFFRDNNLSGVLKVGRQDERRLPGKEGPDEAE